MKSIIVNDVEITHDKEMNGIDGTRITFTDGSWCDAKTKEVFNNGRGSISMGGSSTKKTPVETKKEGPHFFPCHTVDISGITADVTIAVGEQTSITIEGPKNEVDEIQFSQQGDRLVVNSTNQNNPGMTISSGNSTMRFFGNTISQRIITGNGDISVIQMSSGSSSSNNSLPTKIHITVPKGSGVFANNIKGKTTMGDTEGPVNINIRGTGNFSIGKIGDATFTIQGSGDIEVADICGDLTATIQGSGDVKIAKGNVKRINATIMGSGDVIFKGKAEYGSLSVMGSGDIRVTHIANRPTIQKFGSGDIKIGNW